MLRTNDDQRKNLRTPEIPDERTGIARPPRTSHVALRRLGTETVDCGDRNSPQRSARASPLRRQRRSLPQLYARRITAPCC